MSDTRVLLEKITALRQRLEKVPHLSQLDSQSMKKPAAVGGDFHELEESVAEGQRLAELLDGTLRQLRGTNEIPCLPTQLASRARQLLERGRGLLQQLRSLADEFDLAATFERGMGADGEAAEAGPLSTWFRETVAMTDLALRVFGAMPDSPTSQIRLCQGLAPIVDEIAHRADGIGAALGQRRQSNARIESLAELLGELNREKSVPIGAFTDLAMAVLDEAQQGGALKFISARAEDPARFVACHSLLAAQVIARVTRHDLEWERHPLQPILAALIHDVGMLRVPAEVLAHVGPLSDVQKRQLESHTRAGGAIVGHTLPHEGWLAEAAESHHERIDGTGYPSGLKDAQLAPLTKLLSVCDVYAALSAPRVYRSAKESRTALTDTLLLADGGALDRFQAERLLALSFYPVGSVVELADGAVAVVVATPTERRALNAPARPVIALLTDSEGKVLAAPRHLDLAQCEERSILRAVPPKERRALLSGRYPNLAA